MNILLLRYVSANNNSHPHGQTVDKMECFMLRLRQLYLVSDRLSNLMFKILLFNIEQLLKLGYVVYDLYEFLYTYMFLFSK
jgi:hypothetical protein